MIVPLPATIDAVAATNRPTWAVGMSVAGGALDDPRLA
jgi:hypothetical protein